MHVIEEKESIYYKHKRENHELISGEPPALHFKIVVNNYRQQKEEILDAPDDDIDATMISYQHGLPPQPVSYIKYPKYDWF